MMLFKSAAKCFFFYCTYVHKFNYPIGDDLIEDANFVLVAGHRFVTHYLPYSTINFRSNRGISKNSFMTRVFSRFCDDSQSILFLFDIQCVRACMCVYVCVDACKHYLSDDVGFVMQLTLNNQVRLDRKEWERKIYAAQVSSQSACWGAGPIAQRPLCISGSLAYCRE